ncbi:MAG: hypothetical protein AAGC57_10025 [Pseudomonadota bacterium]
MALSIVIRRRAAAMFSKGDACLHKTRGQPGGIASGAFDLMEIVDHCAGDDFANSTAERGNGCGASQSDGANQSKPVGGHHSTCIAQKAMDQPTGQQTALSHAIT